MWKPSEPLSFRGNLSRKIERASTFSGGETAYALSPRALDASRAFPPLRENAFHGVNMYKLPDLPYAYDALEPTISANTLHFHHDKHHAAYVTALNGLLNGDDKGSLEA